MQAKAQQQTRGRVNHTLKQNKQKTSDVLVTKLTKAGWAVRPPCRQRLRMITWLVNLSKLSMQNSQDRPGPGQGWSKHTCPRKAHGRPLTLGLPRTQPAR